MTAKEFLWSVRKAEREIRLFQDRRQHYADLIASIGSTMKEAVVQTSGNHSKTETAAIGLADLEGRMSDKVREYAALVDKAEKLIDQIAQENFREVLTRRYLIGESWKTIRDKMSYSDESGAKKCHGFALKEFQEKMNKND
jgi:hypothetical protein